MNLTDEGSNDEEEEALETEVIDNRTPTQSTRNTRTDSHGPTLLGFTEFTWEEYLNNKALSQWLLQHVIPDVYLVLLSMCSP